MIPLGDVDRKPRTFPLVTMLIIGANVFMFSLELIYGQQFIRDWILVPAEISSGERLITIFTAMFMHGGWLHIIGNMVYFWAFGPEMEDLMGRYRFLVFYLAGGLAASLVQVAAAPDSLIPELGASGAIAAVMGAFLVTFPKDRIRTLVFLGFFFTIPLIPAVLLVGFWFLMQIFSEVGAIMVRQKGGVAYMAHIGGMLYGALAAGFFKSRQGGKRHNLEG
jgi:membrane associated rhomboid family serine protease